MRVILKHEDKKIIVTNELDLEHMVILIRKYKEKYPDYQIEFSGDNFTDLDREMIQDLN